MVGRMNWRLRRMGWMRRERLLPLAAALMAGYVLWMGQGLARSEQHDNHWFFLGPWWTATSIKYLGLAGVLAIGFGWGGDRLRRWFPGILLGLLLGGQLWFACEALGTLRGTFPWGYDHPSFMYRLHEFGQAFPRAIGGYSPWWNAGTEHFVGVTSGSHGYGMLLLPALKIWEPHEFYSAAFAFWYVFGFPWLAGLAARGAGIGRAGALCAALLACGLSRGLFMWAWHFGTVGATTSAMMVMPMAAVGYRLAVLRRGGWGTALALAGAAWLVCAWTPGMLAAAGLGLGWIWNARRWTWRTTGWLAAAGALALALISPWLWTTLNPCRNVIEHVATDLGRAPWGTMLANGAQRLLKGVQEWHPAVAVLGLLGAIGLAPRGVRRWSLPGIVALGLVAGWSREWKALSQLDRMAIPMAGAALLPAAALCGRLFAFGSGKAPEQGWARWARAAARGIVLATILMGFRTVAMHYGNRGPLKLRTFSPEMADFVEWIRREVPEDGRLGFAGRNVHFYGGGNLAYLPILAGREMMGDDYYGFPRGTVEFNYPPEYYRREVGRYLFFGRAYGITHWVATMPEALAALLGNPDEFEPVRHVELLGRDVVAFRVRNPGRGTRFLEGEGNVEARVNRLVVRPADPGAERVVVRYNWRDGIYCKTPGAAIEPHAVDENVRFIAVRPGGNESVEIGYRPHAAPIPPNFDGRFHH